MDRQRIEAFARLGAGEFLHIHDGSGQTIAVFDGSVWITQESDPGDAFIAQGETFTFDRPGLAIVEAMTDSRVAIITEDTAAVTEDADALS